MKKILIFSLSTMYLYAGITGCKYQSDLKKVNIVSNKIKFMMDNHCANVSSSASWKQIEKDKRYTLLQSPYKGEENYKYWVKTNELQKEIKKAELKEKIKKEKILERSKKKDFKTIMEYGDLIWQDSLINETKKMSYAQANSYCKKLNYKGSKNWRLPTLSEMKQIFPASWQTTFQPYKSFKHKQSVYYWTSNDDTQFSLGSGASSRSLGEPALVRCVAPRK